MASSIANVGCRIMDKFDTSVAELQVGGLPLSRLSWISMQL